MSRPKVLLIATRYPSDEAPAVNPFIREHAKAIAAHVDVAVLCHDGAPTGNERVAVTDTVHEGLRTLRIRYRPPRVPGAPHLAYRTALRRALRLLSEDGFAPDLVHAHFYPVGFYAVRLARRLRVPSVVSEHATRLRPGVLSGWEKRRAKWTLEHADVVCPDSHDLARHIRELGIDARLRPVPNVVDTSLFKPGDGRDGEGPPRILFVALLHPRKGLADLLRALAALLSRGRAFSLDVVGDGESRAELERLAAELGLAEHVRFHGIQPKQGVAAFMSRADFFVLPSYEENLPTAIIEALASGLPIVATDVGGVREMVDVSRGLLVPPGERSQLEGAVERMLDEYPNYDRHAIARYGSSHYSYETVGGEFMAIYRALLAGAEG